MSDRKHEQAPVIPVESRPVFTRDPFSGHDAQRITAPSVVVTGVIGAGQSLAPSTAAVGPMFLDEEGNAHD